MATLTGNDRRREQHVQSLMADRISLRYERAIAREIAKTMRRAAKLVNYKQPYQWILSEHKNNIQDLLTGLYKETADLFASYFTATEKFRRFALIQKREVPKVQIVDRIVSEWVIQYGGDLITQISETTMRDINDAVSDGISQGLGEREIAKLIEAVAHTKSASRAQTIARTETSRAANATGITTAKETGIAMLKVWVASGGSRTRDSHRRAGDDYKDGIDLDEPFIVGGERLRYPGDPSGSPEESINCRCVLTYEIL